MKCFTTHRGDPIRKVIRAYIFVWLTFTGTLFSVASNAQLLDSKISISVTNAPFEQVLEEIKSKAKITFMFSHDQINLQEKVTLDMRDEKLEVVFQKIFQSQEIDFKVHEKERMITLKRKSNSKAPEFNSQQKQPLKGKVLDSNGQGIAGVNVLIKGTTLGTSTDMNGEFSMILEEGNVLVFSFIGFISEERQLNNLTFLEVTLTEDISRLKEVIINAGYYQTNKDLQTGNIVKINSEQIETQPVSNPVAALQGRVPGMEVTQVTGVPGGNFRVRIRGTSSIANGNDPLYIVDGVPYISSSLSFTETSGSILGNSNAVAGQGSSPLNAINPSDIESIEVLKDADATSIYGSRGANGVILITTKKGSVGKTKINMSFYTGAAQVARKMDLLTSRDYIKMRSEAFANSKITPTLANARDLLQWDTTRYTDWQKELIGGTAHSTDAQLSLSGGDKNLQMSFGGGYHKETTVFPGENSDERFSFHSSLKNSSFNKKLTTTLSTSYSLGNTNLLRQDLTAISLQLPPVAPAIYNDDGGLSWTNWSSSYENPLAYTRRKYEGSSNSFINNLTVEYSILDDLGFKMNSGFTNTLTRAITQTPISSLDPVKAADPSALNISAFSNSSFKNWIVEPQLNYKKIVGHGKIEALIGNTFLNQILEGVAQTASGFSSEALMKNIGAAPTRVVGTNYYSQYRYQAFFGRINYALKERYILNFTGRRDGSSRFGPGNQYALFGAAGAAWIFSKEKFLEDKASFLSFGKIRTSYGTTGNDQLGDYQYLDTYSSSGSAYQGVVGLTPVRLNNPDYGWEVNKKIEAGLDLGFIGDRIRTSIVYYRNTSSSQLVGYPLAPTTGFASVQGNFPATIRNTGLEVEVNTKNYERGNFSWTTSLNFTIPKNKLVSFPEIENFPAFANRYVVGEPLAIKRIYNETGLGPTGLYAMEDYNNDGVFDFKDKYLNSFRGQQMFGGIQNSLSYNGFQLDVLFQCVKQKGNNYLIYFPTPGILGNQPSSILDRWQPTSQDTDTQLFGPSGTVLTTYARHVESQSSVTDASFVRLKNISLSYTIPGWLSQKYRIDNIRVFTQAQNLLTFTNYKGLDPETQTNSLPPLRTVTAGINLTF